MTHEAEIEALAREIEDLRAPMLEAHAEFVRAATAWATEFWLSHAKEMVRVHHEISAAKGKEGVTNLRTEVETLVDVADEHAQQELIENTRDYWSHLKPDMAAPEKDDSGTSGGSWILSHFSVYSDRPPNLLEQPTQRLLGKVAEVLKAHEYPVTWLPRDDYGRRFLGPEYAQRDWSPEMLQAIEKYAHLHTVLLEKRQALTDLRRKRDEDAAGQLWGD
jgi:hypothetical protein